MQLEGTETQHIEVLAVHGVLPSRTKEGVEIDHGDMPIAEREVDGVVVQIVCLIDTDVLWDLHFMRRVIRTGLMRLCST